MPDRRQQLLGQLSAYLDDELSPPERAQIDALLAGDADARRLLAELRAAAEAVRSLPRARAGDDLMDKLRARLEREALLGQSGPAGGENRSAAFWSGKLIAVAAVIALSFAAAYMMWPQAHYAALKQFAYHTVAPQANVAEPEEGAPSELSKARKVETFYDKASERLSAPAATRVPESADQVAAAAKSAIRTEVAPVNANSTVAERESAGGTAAEPEAANRITAATAKPEATGAPAEPKSEIPDLKSPIAKNLAPSSAKDLEPAPSIAAAAPPSGAGGVASAMHEPPATAPNGQTDWMLAAAPRSTDASSELKQKTNEGGVGLAVDEAGETPATEVPPCPEVAEVVEPTPMTENEAAEANKAAGADASSLSKPARELAAPFKGMAKPPAGAGQPKMAISISDSFAAPQMAVSSAEAGAVTVVDLAYPTPDAQQRAIASISSQYQAEQLPPPDDEPSDGLVAHQNAAPVNGMGSTTAPAPSFDRAESQPALAMSFDKDAFDGDRMAEAPTHDAVSAQEPPTPPAEYELVLPDETARKQVVSDLARTAQSVVHEPSPPQDAAAGVALRPAESPAAPAPALPTRSELPAGPLTDQDSPDQTTTGAQAMNTAQAPAPAAEFRPLYARGALPPVASQTAPVQRRDGIQTAAMGKGVSQRFQRAQLSQQHAGVASQPIRSGGISQSSTLRLYLRVQPERARGRQVPLHGPPAPNQAR
jgi:hypothetical protein